MVMSVVEDSGSDAAGNVHGHGWNARRSDHQNDITSQLPSHLSRNRSE
jgi:hypothetical protein